MLCFLTFSSEQLYISVHRREAQGTEINLYCIESYFILSVGSRRCYRQVRKIIAYWKVFSSCVIQNICTLSNKKHHTITHMLQDVRQITPTHEYIIEEAMNTHNGHSGVFLTEQMWFPNK